MSFAFAFFSFRTTEKHPLAEMSFQIRTDPVQPFLTNLYERTNMSGKYQTEQREL